MINTTGEWIVAIVIGLALTTLDAWAGFPIAYGKTWVVVFAFEWLVVTLVISVSWSYLEVAGAMRDLNPFLFDSDKKSWKDSRLAALDPESIRRLGTTFVDSVAYALIVLLLLIASRLPSLGMARWRWELHDIPVGVLFFGGGIVVISAYWIYGEWTFRTLIRDAKMARIRELEAERNAYLEAARSDAPPASPSDFRETLDRFESRRRDVEAVSEKPWASSDSFRARIALATAVLPWLVPKFLGLVGGSIVGPLSQAIQSLVR